MANMPSQPPWVGGAQKSHGQPGAQLQLFIHLPSSRHLIAATETSSQSPRDRSHTPEATSTTPAPQDTTGSGTSFSASTKAAMVATQKRFITPATNRSAIRSQQHPTQKAPWRSPTTKAPAAPSRHSFSTKHSGDWQRTRHARLSG